MPAHCSRRDVNYHYYIVMIDYGQRGLEAVVNPEMTRRDIVEQVRDIAASGRNTVLFVKAVDDNCMEDVTEEIMQEALDGDCWAESRRSFQHERGVF